MKIITEPTVTVIATPKFIEHPTWKIPSDGEDDVKLGSFAAKGCYDSYGETGRLNTENQLSVMEHRHGSAFEHIHTTVFIEGITRGCSLELNRHRPLNISQRSTRYTKEEDAALVLEPYYAELYNKYKNDLHIEQNYAYLDLDLDDMMIESWTDDEFKMKREGSLLLECLNSFLADSNAYARSIQLLEQLNPNKLSGFELRKWARGKARNLLPHGLETRGTYTNNIRGWRWFIELRSEEHAEPEIRRLAYALYLALNAVHPLYFSDFRIDKIVDSIPVLVPEHSKI